jgi:hypothetical protein
MFRSTSDRRFVPAADTCSLRRYSFTCVDGKCGTDNDNVRR